MNFLRACVLWCLTSAALLQAATFTVITKIDSGAGSLRQAILDANSSPGLDRIEFNIPGAGPMTLTLSGLLPDITDPVEIDGRTQPGFSGQPLVVLSTSRRDVTHLLNITASGSTLRALNFSRSGSDIVAEGIIISGGGGNRITGCWVGLNADGTDSGNVRPAGIHVINSPNNIIGGTTVEDRNIISGSSNFGIELEGAQATGNIIQGNFIGLDPTGTKAVRNFLIGVLITNAPANTIGGLSAGTRNIISGNSTQVQVTGSTASNNVVIGNFIGPLLDGTALPSTSRNGVDIEGAPGTRIGGPTVDERNIIANNYNFGILIKGSEATGTVIQGNYIGTDPQGKTAVPNQTGVRIADGSANTRVFGNVISGNTLDGLEITDSSNNTVQGNLIGTDVSGQAALPNTRAGSSGSGLSVAALSGQTRDNLIGGSDPGAGNVITGNNDSAVTLLGPEARNNKVQGNLIGLARDGKNVLGNVAYGVSVLGANDNLIGGTQPGEGNLIVGNGQLNKREGVWLAGLFGSFGTIGTGNTVVGNTIAFSGGAGVSLLGANEIGLNTFLGNSGIEIDRGGDGPTPNSPQNLVNSPEFASAEYGSIKFKGKIHGKPDCDYVIDIYLNRPVPPPFIFGPPVAALTEPVGLIVVHTDANGDATIDAELPWSGAIAEDGLLKGTAYSACSGETSEASGGIPIHIVETAPRVSVSKRLIEVNEDSGTAQVVIVREGDLTEPSSVRLQTLVSPDPLFLTVAAPGVDFVPVDTTVAFAPGESQKTVLIQINNDSHFSGDRQFYVKLSEPVNATVTGGIAEPGRADVVIRDDEKPPAAVVRQK